MQHILFIGADFEQYLRLKTLLSDFNCVYSVNLPDGIRQFIAKPWGPNRPSP